MIESKVKANLKVPNINLQKDLEYVASRIIIPYLAKGITDRKDITGGSLPKLNPKTIKRKGHDRPLIETGKLRRAFKYRRKGKNTVIVDLRGDRAEIGKFLQIDGIRGKHFNFFGVSKKMERLAISYMAAKIKRILKSGR